MFSWLKSFWQEEEGQGMTEYGLILGIIAIGVIGILFAMRGQLQTIFDNIKGGLEDATDPASTGA
ncbi:MAG TPA: Flp family type IVb pilin [Clostridia bacterium]|nr:Flp family type IVb pilin [Clostridia bacterium]